MKGASETGSFFVAAILVFIGITIRALEQSPIMLQRIPRR